MNKSIYLGVRITPAEQAALDAIRTAYNLSSWSEAARRCIRSAAAARGLAGEAMKERPHE